MYASQAFPEPMALREYHPTVATPPAIVSRAVQAPQNRLVRAITKKKQGETYDLCMPARPSPNQ